MAFNGTKSIERFERLLCDRNTPGPQTERETKLFGLDFKVIPQKRVPTLQAGTANFGVGFWGLRDKPADSSNRFSILPASTLAIFRFSSGVLGNANSN
jgi:hypothetical protein